MKTFSLSSSLVAATLFISPAAFGQAGGSAEMMSKPLSEASDTTPAETPKAKKGKPRDEAIIKRFDRDGDGKLNDEEKAEAKEQMGQEKGGKAANGAQMREELLKRFDNDNDGKLNEAESSAAVDALSGRPRFSKQYDTNSDGKIDDAEKAHAKNQLMAMPAPGAGKGAKADAVRAQMVKRFDKDGDGVLNDAEKAAAQAERAKRKAKD